jgi:hypothetical protein
LIEQPVYFGCGDRRKVIQIVKEKANLRIFDKCLPNLSKFPQTMF